MALHFLQLRALVNGDLQEASEAWNRAFRQSEHHGERRPHPRPSSVPREHHEQH